MVGTRHRAVGDENTLLGLQLLNQIVDVLFRGNLVRIAIDDQARRWARSQEREVIGVWLRCNRHETFDFRTAHQKLHTDPCTERVTGDPTALGIWMQALYPIQRRRGV
ncbi:hypothetical protein D3C71_1920770 [compost metagenome]